MNLTEVKKSLERQFDRELSQGSGQYENAHTRRKGSELIIKLRSERKV